jgi:hypothetical protein
MTAALFISKGTSKLEVKLQRDSFEPHEVIPIHLLIDNSKCDLEIKQFKVKLWREIRA